MQMGRVYPSMHLGRECGVDGEWTEVWTRGCDGAEGVYTQTPDQSGFIYNDCPLNGIFKTFL